MTVGGDGLKDFDIDAPPALNTGGQPLNGQELRNCLYAGNFNDLVTNMLSAGPVFTAIWGIPSHADNIDKAGKPSEELRKNPLYKRMLASTAFYEVIEAEAKVVRMSCQIEFPGIRGTPALHFTLNQT